MDVKKISIGVLAASAVIAVALAGYYFASKKTAPAGPAQTSNGQKPPITANVPLASPDYCFGSQCWKESAISLFQEMFGTSLNSVAPNDPASNSSFGVNGYFFDEDWPQTCSPLKEKVAQLTAGKTEDRDKVLAIANWVAKSRPYGAIMQGKVQNICDLFRWTNGVSSDAAALTVAMLKYAGIPARVVDPVVTDGNRAYEYTSAFVDGKWVYIDSTFGEKYRDIFRSTAILNNLTYRSFGKPREVVIVPDNKFAKDFTYYLADGIFIRTGVATDLVYDNGARKDAPHATVTYIKPWYPVFGLDVINGAAFILKDTRCDYYDCRKSPGTDTRIPMPQQYMMLKAEKTMQISDGKLAQSAEGQLLLDADLRRDYYVTVGLPPGRYEFDYLSSGKKVAYYDFELKPSENVNLSPGFLQKGDGASDVQFKGFVNYLNEFVGQQ